MDFGQALKLLPNARAAYFSQLEAISLAKQPDHLVASEKGTEYIKLTSK